MNENIVAVMMLLALVVLLSSCSTSSAVYSSYCGEKILVGNVDIPDDKFTATRYSRTYTQARYARLSDNDAQAWCIHQPTGNDYIQVQLDRMYRITGIQTKGRYDGGRGNEKVESFQVAYQHDRKGADKWFKWKNYQNTSVFSGNTNTWDIKENKFNPNILGVRAIRIYPTSSENPVCLQFELLGCEWKEKLTSYEIPHPGFLMDSKTKQTRAVPGLLDNTYDGEARRNKLVNGLGQLSDHIVGDMDTTKINTPTPDNLDGYDYIGWTFDKMNPELVITFRFDQLRNFSALQLYYATYLDYRLWERVSVEIFRTGYQLKSDKPYYRKNFARTSTSGKFTMYLGGETSGKFVKLKILLRSTMAVLLSEVVFIDDNFPETPTTRRTGSERTAIVQPLTPYEEEPITTTEKKKKATTTNHNGGFPVVLIIAIFASLAAFVVAAVLTVIYLKKRRTKTQPHRNNYTHVTSRCDGTTNGAGDVAMMTSLSSDNQAMTNNDDYSFAQDSENQNIYQEIGQSENVYLLPVDSLTSDSNQSKADTSSNHTSSKVDPTTLHQPHQPSPHLHRAPPTFPFIPPPLPDHPPPDFPVPNNNGVVTTTKKMKPHQQHEDDDDDDDEHEKCEEERKSDHDPDLSEDYGTSKDDLPPYAEVDLNQVPQNESIQGIAGNALYAVPWDQNQDPKLFELLASSSVENLLSDDTSGVQWGDDRIRQLEFPRDRLTFLEKLGEGQFGEVHLCRADKSLREISTDMTLIEDNDVDGHVMVAAKVLHHDAPRDTKECFLKEVRVMSRLRHENIVRLLAVCTKNEPFAMLTEYMCKGDLNLYLQKFDVEIPRLKNHQQADKNKLISNKRLLKMIMQIASGMKYLASINFVHRDLATRNCLVGNEEMIRISDFGMSRNMYQSHYYKIQGSAILPIRWMAWESLLLGKFSSASDVWSFATTLWEMFSLCKYQPYNELTNQQVVDNLKSMYKRDSKPVLLPRPRRCPALIFAIMRRCWHPEVSKRPDFNEIFRLLKEQEKNGWRGDTGTQKVKKPDKPPIPLPRSATTNPRRSNIDHPVV